MIIKSWCSMIKIATLMRCWNGWSTTINGILHVGGTLFPKQLQSTCQSSSLWTLRPHLSTTCDVGTGGWVHAYEICPNPEMRPGISKYGKPRKTNEDHHLSWGTISLQDLIPRVTRALQDCWMLNNWKQWWFCAWLRTIESVPMWQWSVIM